MDADLLSNTRSGTRWEKLANAAAFALQVHGEQRRKGGDVPYISHLLAVAGLVLEFGGDEDQAIAGLLHDVIEDQGAHLRSVIRERFGERVAAIVEGCTDADVMPKPPWRARKQAHLAHLEQASRDVLLVACADKLHNVRSLCTDLRAIGLEVYGRFNGGRDGTIWYYETLAEAFGRLMPGPLAAELTEAVREMRRLSRPAS